MDTMNYRLQNKRTYNEMRQMLKTGLIIGRQHYYGTYLSVIAHSIPDVSEIHSSSLKVK